jgi:hypothetical protein
MPSTLAMIQKIILPFLLKTLLLKSSRFLFYVFSPVLIQLACGFGRQNAAFLARFCCFILPHKPLFYKHLLQEINKFNKFSQNEHFSFSIADFFRGFLRRAPRFCQSVAPSPTFVSRAADRGARTSKISP